MINFPDDLAAFFDADEFAETATIGRDEYTVIFDRDYIEQDAGGQFFGSRVPVLTGLSSDWQGVTQDTQVTLRDLTFRVVSVEPDNTGLSLIELRRG